MDGSARIAEGFATIEVVGEDADEDELEYRFDVDYDGVFDTQWGPASRWSGQPFEATYARVSVRDRLGNTSGRLLVWESSTPMEPEVPRPPSEDCEGCSATAAPVIAS